MSIGSTLHLVSRTILDWFPLIWLVGLIATGLWCFTRRIPTQTIRQPIARSSEPLSVGALATFLGFVAVYGFVVLYKSGFGDFDDSIITLPIVGAGDDVASVWTHLGRFFPFGNQEWFYVRQVTTSPLIHQALVLIELFVLLGLLYGTLREFRSGSRLVLMAAVMVAPSLLLSFTGLVYPERNLALLIVLLMLAVQAWEERPTRLVLLSCLGLTHTLLYYKEPAFLIVSGFALIRLAVGYHGQSVGTRSLRRLERTHPVETGMLALSVLYLALYVGVMLPHRSASYTEVDGPPLSVIGTLVVYLRSNPVFTLFTAAVMVRLVELIRRREAPDRFWDALAAGAMLYAGTFFWLGMRRPYYLAPVDLIGIMYCAVSARRLVATGWLRPATVATIASLVALLAVCQSWFVLVERKNVIYGKKRIIDFIAGQLDAGTDRPLRIHAAYTRGFGLMEFGSFLEARGIRVARWPAGRADSADVLLESPREFPRGRCVFWIAYRCVHADRPSPGAVVMVLPDDEPSPRGTRGSLRPPGTPSFEYSPLAGPSAIRPALMTLRSWMDPGWHRYYLREDWLAGYAWLAASQ